MTQLRAYRSLAKVYDQMMSQVSYDQWVDYVEELWGHFGVPVNRILDLACGTGTATLILSERGYQMAGVDQSEEMLAVAEQKAASQGQDVYWCRQDMRALDLGETFDCITCFHDSMNYLLLPQDIRRTFQAVRSHLRQDGLFIFDVNTIEALQNMGDSTLFMEEEDFSLVWKNAYQQEHHIWEIDLTLFLKQPGGLYSRTKEIHRERGYAREELATLLGECGFRILASFHALTMAEPTSGSNRLYFVAQRAGD